MRSSGETRWPRCAGLPFTVTRPAAIHVSMSRREPRPARASTFCNFSLAGASAVVGRVLRGGGDDPRGPLVVARDSLGLRHGGLPRRGREVEALGDLFKGRQLL